MLTRNLTHSRLSVTNNKSNSLLCVYLEYHRSGLSYSEGYDFSGGENGLESSIGSSEGFGDFRHYQYAQHHHMENGKQQSPKSVALKGLLVPLAGVALLGKFTGQGSVT
jgi:hypothetical protein